MKNLIFQILRLPKTTDKFLAKAYARIAWLFIWFTVYLATIGPFATGHHLGWINLIPLFLWTVAWTVTALHPRALVGLIALHLPGAESKKKKEIITKVLSDTLPKFFGEIGIWPIILLFYLAIIDASLKPSVAWFIYAAGLVYAFYVLNYNKGARLFKRISAAVAIAMIVISLISLMEPENQLHYFGFNVSASLRASPWDKDITKAEAKTEELQQNKEHDRWEKLVDKMDRDGELTEADYTELNELKEKKFARTIPGKVWNSAKSALLWISPSPKAANAYTPTTFTPAPAYTPPAPIEESNPPVFIAPAPKTTFTNAVIYWGYGYETKIEHINVSLNGDGIILEGNGRLFKGIKDSRGLYSGTWTYGASYGTFRDLDISPNGNIIGTGIISTDKGNPPMQIRMV